MVPIVEIPVKILRLWAAFSVIALLLGGCATTKTAPDAPAEPPAAADEAGTDPAAAAADLPEPELPEPERPRIDLSEDILFRVMVAEIAGQRGRLDVALENYLQLSRETRDPKVVERATRIAVYARNEKAAAEAARIWVELDPLNPDPHQVLAVMALRERNMDEALGHLQNILDHSRGELDEKLLLIANLLGREQDKDLVLGLMEKLVESRRDSPEALYAFAHVAARLGDFDRSIDLLKQTLVLAPDNDNAAMSYVSTLQRQERVDEALAWLEGELERRKDNDFNLRLAYARLLTDARRFDDARRQFELLSVQAPNNVDVQFALGLLYLQANRLEEAERQFLRLVERGERDDDASYYLGRIAEDRRDYEKAGVWYQGVQQGDNYFDAQVRYGLTLSKQGQVEEARSHLRSVRTQGMQEKVILIQAEGELLTEENRFDEAMGVYDEALKIGYNADLLYARAMLAEKVDKLEIVEADLRRILEEEPDHAQALNALGYTLADRTDRFEEAHKLIQRALELNPNDFYILDSMGWILYRLGRLEEAAQYLRRAMTLRQDPEIAAHLGEVLWVMGDKSAALEVWNTALRATPEDTRLLDVMKRFQP